MVEIQHLKMKLRNFCLSNKGTKKHSQPCYIISSSNNTGGFWTLLRPAAVSLIKTSFLVHV